MKFIALLIVYFVLPFTPYLWATDQTQSLAGQWKFAIDQSNVGSKQQWFIKPLAGNTTIKLPGTMDDAGLGPKNTKKPTLEGPYRLYDYAGPAWYQREIEIPQSWDSQRITLFLERCRWVTRVWLDDRFIGSQDSLIAPHFYDFGTTVKPGKHRLTICVDNTVKLDMGRFVSALFGGTWGNMNGIIGRIELNATPPVWIDDVQVYPDIQKMTAKVVVKIGNATGKSGQGTLQVGNQKYDATWNEKGGQVPVVVDMKGAKLWDEFSPNLQELAVKLGEDSRTISFGMRQFSTKGTQFTMNGRPVFLRGTLECSIWPLTGYPPTDVPSWQRIFRIIKSYGLNHMRFRSWCPPEAAFAAADIEGIYIQAEGPMANVEPGKNAKRDAFIEAEYKRIVDTYGNHPSFCTMTLGNEFAGNMKLRVGWINMLIARDSRHLYASASGQGGETPNRQWSESHAGRGVHGTGTMNDLSKVVASDHRPIIGHEIGQWMYWPDPAEIKKWTGVMALKNYEMIQADMVRKHLDGQVPQFVQACGKFATLLYKEEIEVLMRTPGYAGFSLLDLHDYPTQGTALIGPLDAFWDSKGFITPQAYKRFCGPTVPLLRLPKCTYTTDETFQAQVEIAHFGPADLSSVQPSWKIIDEQGSTVASGSLHAVNLPTGKTYRLGDIKASLSTAKTPARLTVTLSANEFSNSWEIWIYPPKVSTKPPDNLLVCRNWSEAESALQAGKNVVLFPSTVNPKNALPGKFIPVFWSPVWFPSQKPNTNGILCNPRHPLFAQFPTDSYSNWQWWDLLNNSHSLILDETPGDFKPIVQVMDNFARNHKLGNTFEAQVSKGNLLVCTIDLPGMAEKHPVARQLLHSLYEYVGSPAFRPEGKLDPSLLDRLLTGKPAKAARHQK